MSAKLPVPTIEDASVFYAVSHCDIRGELAVLELPDDVRFPIVRMFFVSGVPKGVTRGGHAHRANRQVLVCQSGEIEVQLSDGRATRTLLLSRGHAVNIPPGLYVTQKFLSEGAVLLVLCDHHFDESDYIREHDVFIAYRRHLELPTS